MILPFSFFFFSFFFFLLTLCKLFFNVNILTLLSRRYISVFLFINSLTIIHFFLSFYVFPEYISFPFHNFFFFSECRGFENNQDAARDYPAPRLSSGKTLGRNPKSPRNVYRSARKHGINRRRQHNVGFGTRTTKRYPIVVALDFRGVIVSQPYFAQRPL